MYNTPLLYATDGAPRPVLLVLLKPILTRRKQEFINIVSVFCWWIWGAFKYASCSRIKLWPFLQTSRTKPSHFMVYFPWLCHVFMILGPHFEKDEELEMPLSFLKFQRMGCQMSDHMLILDITYFGGSLNYNGEKGRSLSLKVLHRVLFCSRLSSLSCSEPSHGRDGMGTMPWSLAKSTG